MHKTNILYVEDEPFLGKIVKESLESRGFQVKMVDDGLLVMDAVTEFNPDLCILDVMLPHRDGFQLGEDIRAKYPHLPIIFVTAKTQTEDVLKGFQSGGNDYLRKPFSMEELIARVLNLLNLRGQPSQGVAEDGVFQLGNFQYDARKFELRLGTQVQKLSYREAELLKILIEHRNLPVERKRILQRIWGDDSFFNSRNLDVYITHLREYLRGDPNIQIITLKGVGYQFNV
ncbi:MAG: response regulator transcription factor [Haliscomenobacter sp.]